MIKTKLKTFYIMQIILSYEKNTFLKKEVKFSIINWYYPLLQLGYNHD